jgi:hypothetical protein
VNYPGFPIWNSGSSINGGSRGGASTYAFSVTNINELLFDEPREHERPPSR